MYSDFFNHYRVPTIIVTEEGKFFVSFSLGKTSSVNALEFEEFIKPFVTLVIDTDFPYDEFDKLKAKPINEFEIIKSPLSKILLNINNTISAGIGSDNKILFPDFSLHLCTELENVESYFLETVSNKNNSHSYFENKQCKYYPCHPFLSDMNCLFCYCPLYPNPDCIGNPSYITSKTGKTIKDCSHCVLPHISGGWKKIIAELTEE